jgi:hypothetical protein
VLKTLKNSQIVVRLSIWLVLSLLLFLTPFLDNGSLSDSIGAARAVLFLILIPGAFVGLKILKIRELVSSIIIGSAILISFIIPIHALLSKFGIAWIFTIGLSVFSFYLLLRFNKYLYIEELRDRVVINLRNIILVSFSIIILILLFRQSLYVPASNLDKFLVWPDTYNALAQAGEISNHGPSIFSFVAESQVPLKYHWGAFSLGSFITFFGLVELVVSIFKTQFMLLGILYFGLLYLTGKVIGKSWIAGIFAMILGGLTIYPTFPEFNDQIGLARPFISSTSMPQFTANVFAILAIYLTYFYKQLRVDNKVKIIVLFFVTLSATLSKGPVGLLIVILILSFIIFNYKVELKNNLINLLSPTTAGFILGYSQISSNSSIEGRSGTSLWLNPLATLKLLAEGYGLTLDSRSIAIFIILFIFSFSSLVFVSVHMYYQKTINLFFPLVVTILAGIVGTLVFETWGSSQLFLLYSATPFIGVLLASSAFYEAKDLSTEKVLLLGLGLVGQPVLFQLFSSFVPRAQVLRTFGLWVLAMCVIFFIAGLSARVLKKNLFTYLLITSLSIGMFSGLTKFDQKAYSLPEHPYSISIGTAQIAKYLQDQSSKNDLIATNRHCAGPDETQTCTARQFALSGLSERRVLLEGWSYTTCPLSEPILNKYWNEDFWKLNQDFFINPNAQNWELFQKTGVDWLVVDSTRPSVASYQDFAELVKSEGSVSLWKIKNPYQGEIFKRTNSCSGDSLSSQN